MDTHTFMALRNVMDFEAQCACQTKPNHLLGITHRIISLQLSRNVYHSNHFENDNTNTHTLTVTTIKRAYNARNGFYLFYTSICRSKKIYRSTFCFGSRKKHKTAIKIRASCCKEVGKISGKESSTFLISLSKRRKAIRSFVCKQMQSMNWFCNKDDNFNVLDRTLRKCQSSERWNMSNKFCHDKSGSMFWLRAKRVNFSVDLVFWLCKRLKIVWAKRKRKRHTAILYDMNDICSLMECHV